MLYLNNDKVDCLISLLLKKKLITDDEWREAENDLIQLRFQQSMQTLDRTIPIDEQGEHYGENKN